MDAETIVRFYADMIYKIAYRYTRSTADAEDVFSQVWLIYFKKERTFESEEHRKAWLIRVTINAAKELLSQQRPTEELNEQMVSQTKELMQEDIMDLRSAMEKLDDKYREVICLFYLQDMSVREIAAVLDRNENTVKVQLSRGRDKLRQMLGATQ